jgi:hypothetical protein
VYKGEGRWRLVGVFFPLLVHEGVRLERFVSELQTQIRDSDHRVTLFHDGFVVLDSVWRRREGDDVGDRSGGGARVMWAVSPSGLVPTVTMTSGD